MKFKIVLFLLFTVTLVRSGQLFSEDQSQESLEVLTFVASEDNMPFSFNLPDGTPSGLYVEFWQLWAKTNNISIRFVLVPLEEGLELVKYRNTVHVGLFRNEQREQWADFSLPIHNVQTGVIYNGSINKKTKLRKLNGIKVSAERFSFQADYLREKYTDIEQLTYVDFDDALNKLLDNDIQAVVAELPYVFAQLAKSGLSGVFVVSDEIIVSNDVFALIAKGQPELLDKINTGIENIPIDEIIELEKKWLPTLKPFFKNLILLNTLTTSEKKWIQRNSSLIVGVEPNARPLGFINKQGNYSGIASKYIDYIKKMLGIKIEPAHYKTWNEAFEAFKEGKVDMMSGIVNTPEREKMMDFTVPYFELPTVIVTRKNSFYTNTMEGLAGKKVGLVDGYAVEFIKRDYPEINIQLIDSITDGFARLQAGEIDAMIDAIASINYEINKGHVTDLIVTAFTPYKVQLSMVARKGLEPLIPILNKVFASMSEEQHSAIANNWLSIHVQKGTELSTIFVWVLPIVSLLILIILIFFRLNKKFKELSLTDQLTGLRNRRFLQNNLKNDIDTVLRINFKTQVNITHDKQRESDLIFFMLDFDNFKHINDIHGHTAGDAVLIQIKSVLEKVFRKTDYLVRWGGEEFLVVSRFLNREHAPELAERLRQSIETYDFDIGQEKVIRKTCSIGYACYPFLVNKPEYLTWEQVVDIADHCMYVAKKSTRNAWLGLNNVNYNEESIASNITERTKEFIDLKQLEVETSIADKSLLRWD
jgi:diguanylate cyclase (GGDEF)-like protein